MNKDEAHKDGAAVLLLALREPKGPEVVKTPGQLGKKWGKCWGQANTTAPPRSPLLSMNSWTEFLFLFHPQRIIDTPPPSSLAAAPFPKLVMVMRKATAQRTPAGCGDRGSPRLPAIPTPQANDIRGSRGPVLPQSPARGVRAYVRGEPGLAKLVALTLLKFIQAARAAEGAHGGCLPAAASLHPQGPRPPSSWALHGARSRARSSEDCRAEAAMAASARESWRRVAQSTGPP